MALWVQRNFLEFISTSTCCPSVRRLSIAVAYALPAVANVSNSEILVVAVDAQPDDRNTVRTMTRTEHSYLHAGVHQW